MLVIKVLLFFTVGGYSGSTCRMSSAAEKEDIKDAFENDEMPVGKTKYFELESELVDCVTHQGKKKPYQSVNNAEERGL